VGSLSLVWGGLCALLDEFLRVTSSNGFDAELRHTPNDEFGHLGDRRPDGDKYG